MIREAAVTDLFVLVQHGEAFWEKTPYCGKIPYNPQAVRDLLTVMIEDHYLYVYTEQLNIVGFLGMMEVPMVFNPEYTVATELFFYVHPAYRERGVGQALYKYAEEDIDSDIIAFCDMSTSTDLEEYYKSLGFTLTERTYTKVR